MVSVRMMCRERGMVPKLSVHHSALHQCNQWQGPAHRHLKRNKAHFVTLKCWAQWKYQLLRTLWNHCQVLIPHDWRSLAFWPSKENGQFCERHKAAENWLVAKGPTLNFVDKQYSTLSFTLKGIIVTGESAKPAVYCKWTWNIRVICRYPWELCIIGLDKPSFIVVPSYIFATEVNCSFSFVCFFFQGSTL